MRMRSQNLDEAFVGPGPLVGGEEQSGLIDLTLADSDSDEEIDPAQPMATDERDVALWKKTVGLFGLKPDGIDVLDKASWHRPPGCLKPLTPVQLLALAKIFDLCSDGEIDGALIQFDTGLGKTFIGHAFAALSFALRELVLDIRDDRKEKGGRHLPISNAEYRQGPDDECPQGTYAHGIACPCVERLPSRYLVKGRAIRPGPTLILVPPSVLAQWRRHLSAHIDGSPWHGSGKSLEI